MWHEQRVRLDLQFGELGLALVWVSFTVDWALNIQASTKLLNLYFHLLIVHNHSQFEPTDLDIRQLQNAFQFLTVYSDLNRVNLSSSFSLFKMTADNKRPQLHYAATTSLLSSWLCHIWLRHSSLPTVHRQKMDSVSFWGYTLTKYSRGVRKEGLWLMPGVWAASSLCGALHRLETWSLFKGDPRQTQLSEDKDHVQMFPFVGFAWLLCRYLCSRSFFCFKFELFRVQIHWFTFFTNEEQKKAGSSTLLPHVLATLIMWQTWSKQMRSKLGFCDLQMLQNGSQICTQTSVSTFYFIPIDRACGASLAWVHL